MSSQSPDRTLRRVLTPATQARRPVSPLATVLKLAGGSLVLGLMLVSLDITPGSVMALATDIGPIFERLGHSLWRAAEILLSCLLAGAVLVLPAYYLQRWWAKRKTSAVSAAKRLVPAEAKSIVTPTDLAKPLPVAPLPVAKTP